jgi:hypothetical protein
MCLKIPCLRVGLVFSNSLLARRAGIDEAKKTLGSPRAHLCMRVVLGIIAAIWTRSVRAGSEGDAGRAAPEARAVAFLVREVPRWKKENHCFSCHNNGDAARALIDARIRKLAVPPGVVDETLSFLSHPERWDKNGVDAAFSDKRLARLQFAVALEAAVAGGQVAERAPLVSAAEQVAADQSSDGSWPIDEAALIGSPATYGRSLATALARQVLASAGAERFTAQLARAEQWLRRQPARNVVEASAVVIAFAKTGPRDEALRERCLKLLCEGQDGDGGWGPFVNAPPEAFDTAIALLALCRYPDRAVVKPQIGRGRAFLVATQTRDGSWPETTRPTGGESYAQRLSTTGWATLALFATQPAERSK